MAIEVARRRFTVEEYAVSGLRRETEAGAWDPRVVTGFLEVVRHLDHDAMPGGRP